MRKFRDLFLEKAFNTKLEFPSTSVSMDAHTLNIRFNTKDVVIQASYEGPSDPWLSSLCYLIDGKSLSELSTFSWESWKSAFRSDVDFWDFFQDEEDKLVHRPLELLQGTLGIYQGKDHLYKNPGNLVCRCFGIKEEDILEYLKKEDHSGVEGLMTKTHAGMGCRSCLSQIKRWFFREDEGKNSRYFKQRPIAEWILDIDLTLSTFTYASDWRMEVGEFKDNQVTIYFDKNVPQKEEEAMGRKVQDFLARSVDSDLSFFLMRARHFSKAKG